MWQSAKQYIHSGRELDATPSEAFRGRVLIALIGEALVNQVQLLLTIVQTPAFPLPFHAVEQQTCSACRNSQRRDL